MSKDKFSIMLECMECIHIDNAVLVTDMSTIKEDVKAI